MNDSYRLLMKDVKRRHPQIPAFVFRWSSANFLLYLARKAMRAEEYANAIGLLGNATFRDPELLLNRRVQRLMAKCLNFGLGRRSNQRLPSVGSDNPLEWDLSRWRSDSNASVGDIWARRRNDRIVRLQALQNHLGLNVPGSVDSRESLTSLPS
jgi:hypothetical protein